MVVRGGIQAGGDDLLVIEPYYGDISWNGQPQIAKRVVGTHRHSVIETEQSGRAIRSFINCMAHSYPPALYSPAKPNSRRMGHCGQPTPAYIPPGAQPTPVRG